MQETEGKHKDCWVMKLDESAEFEGMDEPDKILVRSNGTVTYTGKDIAYQLWKFGLLDRTFDFRKFSTYADGHVLWETTSGDGSIPTRRASAARKSGQRHRRPPGLSAEGGEGRRPPARPRARGGELDPLLVRDGGAHARHGEGAGHRDLRGRREEAVHRDVGPQRPRRQGRRPDRRAAVEGGGVGARRDARRRLDRRRGRAARPADRRRRAALLHAQVRPEQSHRLRLQRGADVRGRFRPLPAVLDRARARTSSARWPSAASTRGSTTPHSTL